MTEPRIDLPQNVKEAKEVIEVTAKEIIVRNYITLPDGKRQLQATKAAQEIADLFAVHATKVLTERQA
jgi:hypothetical protein